MMRFVESFDHYTDISAKWDGTNQSFLNITTGGRFGTNCGQTGGAGTADSRRGAFKNFSGTESTWIIGCAWSQGSYSNGQPVMMFSTYELGSGLHTGVWIDSVGRLSVRRNTTALATYSIPFPQNGYHCLEFKVTIHDTTGAYELRLDGVTLLSASGVDTKNGGTGYSDRIYFTGNIGSGDGAVITYAVDDIVIMDGVDSGIAGAPNNDFLGDVRVECRMPSGNGNSSQLVGSDANSTDNYLLVDDPYTAVDDDTTYVESSTVGDKDTYAYQDLSSLNGSVYGMQMIPRARKTDAGTRKIASITRLSGTEQDSADKSLISTYTYQPDIREADPAGNQWTITNVNAAEYGVKVTA